MSTKTAISITMMACCLAATPAHAVDDAPAPREVRLIPAPSHIAQDVERSAAMFTQAASMAPGVMATAMKSYTRNGIAFFFSDDPEVREQANAMGFVLGQAVASFAEAIRKDMVKVAHESFARVR